MTPSATRQVFLTCTFRRAGRLYRISGFPIRLARPAVVLVHGINSGPTAWMSLVSALSDPAPVGGIRVRFPFVTTDHSAVLGGNGPVEVAAAKLKRTIDLTLAALRAGEPLPPAAGGQPFSDYAPFPLAARRVDLVAWSYGGVVARWYLASDGSPASSAWYRRDYQVPPAATTFGGDVRKLITLGSMWRGVPLCNYLNEVLFAKPGRGVPALAAAPINAVGRTFRKPKVSSLVQALPILTDVPSMEVMAVSSPWLRHLLYRDPSPDKNLSAHPFLDAVAYGSVAGDDNAYPILPDIPVTLGVDAYSVVDALQRPSWFPYLQLERKPGASQNYSDGLVPLWSAAIPGSYSVAAVTHDAFPANRDVQEYVARSLNNAGLPSGAVLNQAWGDPGANEVRSFGDTRAWRFRSGEMAPHAEEQVYRQLAGLGRIEPSSLKESDSVQVSNFGATAAVISWTTAAESDSTVAIADMAGGTVPLSPFQVLSVAKRHVVLLDGLRPKRTYGYSIFYSPDGVTPLSPSTTPSGTFRTGNSDASVIAFKVTAVDSGSRTVELEVRTKGAPLREFSVGDASFDPPTLQFAGSQPSFLGVLGPPQRFRIGYSGPTGTRPSSIRLTYGYTDLTGQGHPGSASELKLPTR